MASSDLELEGWVVWEAELLAGGTWDVRTNEFFVAGAGRSDRNADAAVDVWTSKVEGRSSPRFLNPNTTSRSVLRREGDKRTAELYDEDRLRYVIVLQPFTVEVRAEA